MWTLTIWQPWAWLIVHGFKDIENRNWPTGIRAPIGIHAGQKMDMIAYADIKAGRHPARPGLTLPTMKIPGLEALPRGCLVGVAHLSDCVVEHDSDWFVGPYGFVLSAAAPLRAPIPYRGLQKFFDVPDEVFKAAGGPGVRQT
jgi:hypothetical protein